MLRHSGRAAREVGQVLHRVCHFALTLTVALSVVVIGGAWRLSRGPVDLGFLKARIEKAVNKSISPARMTIGGASIAWGGFSHGLDQPLILRVTDLAVEDIPASAAAETSGQASGMGGIRIPLVEAALSARWLLIGRVLPRTITLNGAHLVLVRDANGSVSFDIGGAPEDAGPLPLHGLLAAIGAPTETDLQAGGGRFSQLTTVSISRGTVLLDDHLLGATLSAERADIDLTRHRGGGMDGKVGLTLSLGGQEARLNGTFNLPPAASSVHVAAELSEVTPKALAASAQVLAPLAALDLPMRLTGEADLRPDLTPAHLRLTARAGAGKLNTDGGSIPIRRAELTLTGTPEAASFDNAVVELQPSPDAAISTVGVSGQLTRRAGRLAATLRLTLDHVDFTDLPALWPADFSPPTRAWISKNITAGTARDGKAALVLETQGDPSDVTLVSATGTLEGQDVAVTWLPTVPRVEQVKAHLVLTDPDKIEIDVRSGRQKVNGADPIAIQYGHVTITGLSQKDQDASVQCDAAGSLPSAIALLKEPRLRILDRHPMDLRAPAGDVRMGLHVTLPLADNLQIDDVTIHGTANLSKTHLTGIAAGRDLDDGTFSLDVDTNQLSLKGTAKFAGIPANIDALMDFRAGPPSQVLQRYSITGRTTVRALADAGLDTQDALSGDVGINVTVNEYRSGDGDVTADADLAQAALTVAPLGWRKPEGIPAKASARLSLSHDKLTGVDRLVLDGAGAQVRGAATVFGGKLDTVRLDRLALGRTDVRGTIRLPQDGPIGLDLSGPVLDISAKLLEKTPKKVPLAAEPPAGPSWSLRGRFDRVILAHDQTASQLVVAADNDGRLFRALTVSGKSASNAPFSVRIGQGPTANGHPTRRLAIDVKDAGTLLNGLDISDSIEGGKLSVTGDFDDTTRDHKLSGTIELDDFHMTRDPALGKLLQAVTLYGLVDALDGPGLSFAGLTAPFELDENALVLTDARAFSPSLGLTVHGWIDRSGDNLDLEGTLVPAYVFNSLLGRIPLVGRLFSVEKGGGLFAMNYSLRGPTDNPTVTANLFSALTPGILRGMFGMFDQGPPGRQPRVDRESAGGNGQTQ